MFSITHIKDQLLWTGTNVAWPSVGSGQHINFTKIGDGPAGSLTTGGSTIAPAMALGPIDNSINADYCLITFNGTISDIVTGGAPAGESIMRGGVFSLPFMGAALMATSLGSHPVTNQTIPISKADAWYGDSVGGISQVATASPPYYGMFFGASYQISVINNGWPFNGNTIAIGDEWLIQFPIGRMTNEIPTISGLRYLWIHLKSVNPTLVLGSPTSMSITGTIYAHLYEFRRGR